MNCISYSFEDEDTHDHDLNVELIADISPFQNNEDDDENIDDDDIRNKNDDSHDTDYSDECKNENVVRHRFSLEYMKNMVQFYRERNPKTRKRDKKKIPIFITKFSRLSFSILHLCITAYRVEIKHL